MKTPPNQRSALRFGNGLLPWWAGLLAVAFLAPRLLCAEPEPPVAVSPEHRIKAAYLLNFTRFVTWPGRAFLNAGAPLTIGVAGQNPFGSVLQQIIEGEKVNGRPIVIREFAPGEDLTQCHVLFIPRAESSRVPAILASLRDAPVLTVSETEDFLEQNGMINFLVQDKKVRFEIGQKAAEQAGLVLSSRLLKLAVRVITNKSETGK
ncbi:MAG: YfiR family protein [Verrucomicrobia bacterium]|nr:YfiR family protein [Verrucomicrobiota bacterium]